MNRRLAIAILALAGLFISLYLWLYKLGMIGTLACGTGGCETVQLSPQSRFLGVEVALIGVIGYVVILGLAMAAMTPRFEGLSWPIRVMPLVTGGAVLFTAYLKYLEFFVIHAICRWCVASAVIVAVVFVLSVLEWRRERAAA
ncbi:MAG: vitamin K epoxide reductase family protein [Gemmatimonadales bacterium]|nr:vitamin K epoxide reductase family protein [Gemmatimonadales bacterium]